jgi:hypothetical protein
VLAIEPGIACNIIVSVFESLAAERLSRFGPDAAILYYHTLSQRDQCRGPIGHRTAGRAGCSAMLSRQSNDVCLDDCSLTYLADRNVGFDILELRR